MGSAWFWEVFANGSRTKPPPTGYPEFGVRRETISSYFEPPLARSTFHDLVNKGQIVPMKGLRGFYRLNDSLRRLGLREVPSLPQATRRSGEDLVRLAFLLIDPDVLPPPSWLLGDNPLEVHDVDHALRLAEQHKAQIEGFQTAQEKIAYQSGALDSVLRDRLHGSGGDHTRSGCRGPLI